MAIPQIKVVPDTGAMVLEAAGRIVDVAGRCEREGLMCSLFLSGGSTPKSLYELLATEPWRSQIDWRSIEIYFGDERCVPPDSKDSNYRMAADSLLSKVPIPPAHVHRMRGEIDPEQAAKEYGQLLKEKFADEGPDVLLLGMGDDGHTASLFPGTTALDETHHRCVANFVPHDYIPKGTSWRVTVTFPFINRSRLIMILCGGAAKASRVQEVLEGPVDPRRLPIQGVDPAEPGQLVWILDAGAAGMTED